MSIDAAVLTRLKKALGPKGFTEDKAEIAPHLVEWRSKYHGHTPILLKPAATAEVSRVLSICNETQTPVVPQGGNTGLVGGQIPLGGEVLLGLQRMNAVRRIDAEGMSVVVEAGVILADLQHAAERIDRYFPLSLASEGSCTIGGNLSTNAGGVNVLQYGTARDLVLGLEVVLADGRVLDLLRTLRKDNTGYDLKQLFVGSEGTLGIITAAALKLFPKPSERGTALVAVADVDAAITLLNATQKATGGLVSAFELLPRFGLELVFAHIPQASDPLSAPSPWYVLIEVASAGSLGLQVALNETLSSAIASNAVTNAVIASNDAQRGKLWRLRESLSEAQRLEGASIKHDISVPIASIPAFIDRGVALVERIVPGTRPVIFGHLGDSNLHFNFSAPKGGDASAFLAKWSEVSRAVHDLVHELGGSISAEHGVGVLKRAEIVRYKSAAEIELMRALKRTLDPNNILNPGKVIEGA